MPIAPILMTETTDSISPVEGAVRGGKEASRHTAVTIDTFLRQLDVGPAKKFPGRNQRRRGRFRVIGLRVRFVSFSGAGAAAATAAAFSAGVWKPSNLS